MPTFDERLETIKTALVKRTRADEARALRLAEAYLNASLARAEAVTTGASPPPTAFKSAQLGLVLALLTEFKDVPAVDEVAALLRVTKAAANTLLNEVLATSDDAVDWSVVAVFGRATSKPAGGQAALKDAKLWTFRSLPDMNLARERLEFEGVKYKTESSTDGTFRLLVDEKFVPPAQP